MLSATLHAGEAVEADILQQANRRRPLVEVTVYPGYRATRDRAERAMQGWAMVVTTFAPSGQRPRLCGALGRDSPGMADTR